MYTVEAGLFRYHIHTVHIFGMNDGALQPKSVGISLFILVITGDHSK